MPPRAEMATWNVVCDVCGTFSMSVSCSRSLVSLSIGRASADKSQSQLPKLWRRLASSMVMILEQKEQVCKSKVNPTVCVCVCVVRVSARAHLPATRGRIAEEVVDHV